MRVRGNAYQVMEKYLAWRATRAAAGDRIAMENYLQHAEHYYRMHECQRRRPIAAAPARTDGNGSHGTGNGVDGPGDGAGGWPGRR